MDTIVDVIGTGGVGGFMVSSLYQGGLRPRVISRGPALKRLRKVGLTIQSENTTITYTPIHCLTLEDAQEFAPIILLTTKSYDIPAVLDKITQQCTTSPLFVSVQNGFAAYDAISDTVGPERAAMGVLYVSAYIVSPGVIDVKANIAQFFLPEQHRTVLQPLVDTLNNADVEAALVDDIERRMWVKQIFLVPFSIVNAQTHLPIGMLLEDEQACSRWLVIAQEITAIAQACAVNLPNSAPEESMAKAKRFDPQADSSFARDIWANKPHEAEALFKPLLRRARRHNIDSPLLQQAYDFYSK